MFKFFKHKKFDYKNFQMKIIFLFIYILSISITSTKANNIYIENTVIDTNKCHWIPTSTKKLKNLVKRICLGKNNMIYEVTFNIKARKTLNKKLLGSLEAPLVFKDKKDLINKNKDYLIYSKIINGNLFIYSCQRVSCNPIENNYKKIGLRKYFWD